MLNLDTMRRSQPSSVKTLKNDSEQVCLFTRCSAFAHRITNPHVVDDAWLLGDCHAAHGSKSTASNRENARTLGVKVRDQVN